MKRFRTPEDEDAKLRMKEKEADVKNVDSTVEFIKRWWESYDILSKKFNDDKFKRKRSQLRRARQGEFDKLTNSLLSMVGGNISAKLKENEFVYIGIGEANFYAGEAQSAFEKYFVRKVRSLGYLVSSINEYFTSQKCPRCHCFTEFANGIRVK